MGNIGYIIIGLAVTFILYLIWKTLNWVWFTPKKLEKHLRKQGLKGNSYKLLYGDIKEIVRMHNEARGKPIPFTNNDYIFRMLPFLHRQISTYGENCWTWKGPTPVIHIQAPELTRDALSRMNEFIKPRTNPLVELLLPGFFLHEGEKWAKHRKLVNPAFHMEKIKFMISAMGTSIIEMTSKWEKMVSETGSIEVDVWPYCKRLSGDALSRASFSGSYNEGNKIFELLKEQIELVMQESYSVNFPGRRFVPTKNNRRIYAINSEIQSILMGMIDKRQKAMEGGEFSKEDLLGILMDSNIKASQNLGSNKKKMTITVREIIDECKLFYFAGKETTSVLLGWTLILLSKHQDWQTRAREEVLATIGKNQPDLDGLKRLKIVNMILHEVLRLYPSVPELSRKVKDGETKLGDIIVPPGAVLSLSILHTHHDPKIWGNDALDFNPERFAEGIPKASNGKPAYFPFGWGPRICVGQNFSMTETRMAVSMLLQRFSFELSASYTHAPTTFLTLQAQHGAHLIIRPLE